MEALSSYFAMGGYAVFVWPSYVLALVGLLGILMVSRRSLAQLQNDLDRLRPRREETTSGGNDADAQAEGEHP